MNGSAPSHQLALDFTRPEGKGPEIHRFQVNTMIEMLRGRGWQTAEQLGAHTETDKRILRAIAESAGGAIVSYPGSPGYKLLDACTLTELRHGDRAMRSQLKHMAAKWKPIWRRMHQLQLVEAS